MKHSTKTIQTLFGTVLPVLFVVGLAVNTMAQSVAMILFEGSGTLSAQRKAPSVSGLFTMNPDGSALAQLSNDSYARNPVWSPGQAYIAYQQASPTGGSPTIYIMDAIGTLNGGRTFAVTQGLVPAWSPDGTQLVFQGNDYNLYIVSVNPSAGTAGTPVLFAPGGLHKYDPSWSPDGTSIAFERETSSSTSAVFTRSVSTGSEVQLPAPFAGVMMVPSWSADSTQIAFVAVDSNNLGGIICLANADGTNLRVLASYPNNVGALSPTWSPDGTAIALQVQVPNGKRSFQNTICRQDLTSGAFTLLTPATLSAGHPNWAP
jgi:Tol biopolymer transport system component